MVVTRVLIDFSFSNLIDLHCFNIHDPLRLLIVVLFYSILFFIMYVEIMYVEFSLCVLRIDHGIDSLNFQAERFFTRMKLL